VTICDFAESGHSENGYRKWLFCDMICELVHFDTSLAYSSTDLLIWAAAEQIIIRSTFASGELTSLH
jgi:hypothetical protein